MASDIQLTTPDADKSVTGYSAKVTLELFADGRVFHPSHTSFDSLRFRKPVSLAQSTARLVITVDGIPHATELEILPHPMPSTQIPVRIIKKL
jgi:hypothetical protein